MQSTTCRSSSSFCVCERLLSHKARAKTPRALTRVAADSFTSNGQSNGQSSQALTFKSPQYDVVFNSQAPDPVTSSLPEDRRAKKLELSLAISGTNRGTLANLPRHRKIWRLLQELQAMNPTEDAFEGSPAPLDGPWELLYSSAESFRSSPFFWAFQEGLVQDRDMAGAIFRFTDGIPGADIGRAVQRLDSSTGALVSEVDMTVFPGVSGVVVTTSSIAGTGLEVEVTVLDTRVDNSLFAPVLDNVVVPVKDLIERVRGEGATKTTVSVVYLDDEIRVMRTPDEHFFVYGRPA